MGKKKQDVLPNIITDESKFYLLANEYLRKIVRKQKNSKGLDILELLSVLAFEKSPTISGGASHITDDEYLGSTWIVGSQKAVDEKITSDTAAHDIVELIRQCMNYSEMEIDLRIKQFYNEICEALKKYDGIGTNLYFLFDEKQNAIKIGRSINVNRRNKTLQTGSPNKLKRIYQCPARVAWEKLIKHELSAYIIRGEWYRAEKEVFKFILWLKCVQESNISPDRISRSIFDNEIEYERAMKELLIAK